MYRETVQNFASQEYVCEMCVLRQSVRQLQPFYFLILTITGVGQKIPLEFRNFTFHENMIRNFGVYSCLQKDEQADVGQHEEVANTVTPGLDELQSPVTFSMGIEGLKTFSK